MAVESSGSQAATISTEHTLASPTTDGKRQLCVDLNVLASGDTVELRVYKKYASGGTARLVTLVSFPNAQSSPGNDGFVYTMPYGGSFSLKQTTGTGRTFDWFVYAL